MDRRQAVEDRRKELETKELERKEAIIAKNRERETRVETQRRSSRGNMEFAFGSSAPRMMEPRLDSASGYWGTRSASGQQMFERSSASVDRETPGELRTKRTASAHGLNMSTEGDDPGAALSPSGGLTAHRRRTDLVPTIVMSRTPGTPGSRHRSPGISRENSTASARSAMSSAAANSRTTGVRLRSAGARRPRPLSIATTGMTSSMTSSMYEERQKPALVLRDKSLNTPKAERMKRARSVTSDSAAGDNEDARSVSSVTSGTRTPARKTPSQVKAENAARKSKTSTPKLTSTPKSSLGNVSNGTKEVGKASSQSKTPSPAMSQDNIEAASDVKRRQSTPDIIKDNNRKNVETSDSKEGSPSGETTEEKPGDVESQEAREQRRLITSEEEAKARIAEKRREMKEQKEREAELERLRLEEEARLEAERLRQEEEEEKKLIALEQEARKAAEERRKKEEEEKSRAEKEEQEKKMKAEAEKREAELQEKLQKEEEERLARKKRIEEITARTRGAKAAGAGAGGTPKKDPAETNTDTNPSQTSPAQQPASLDTNVDPTKPDLLGDITDQVEEENAKNLMGHSGGNTPAPPQDEPDVEKGALDSISSKSDENDNSSPLINIEAGDGGPVKKFNGVMEGSSFDQILDLNTVAVSDSNKAQTEIPPPMMAFEESIQQQNNNTADLLS